MRTDATIVAPATPRGESGLAVIRLSGDRAESILRRIFRPARPLDSFESHRLYYGHAVDGSEVVDEVMAVLMRAPKTFTREDVAEIHCHGGPLPVSRIVALCLRQGAVMARPGEFTLRAFLNGRLDLAQAEAVAGIIHARSEAAGRAALGQLEGRLSSRLRVLKKDLVELLAHLETHIDFVEEDIDLPDQDKWCERVAAVRRQVEEIAATYTSGRMLKDGVRVLILGKPNVGKSSLLNCMLGESRAIVSEWAGTTRDTIEENLVLNGFPLRLIDTAGIRQTEDPVEKEGVERARQKIRSADLVLFLVDGSRPIDDDDRLVFDFCPSERTLLVVNKIDLQQSPLPSWLSGLPRVSIGARDHIGIDRLGDALCRLLGDDRGDAGESLLVYESRHYQALLHCSQALDRLLQSLEQGESPEFLAVDLQDALRSLGEITGETTPDDVLDTIFSQFCIGK
ncbi:tRNA modification GTPase trmE [Geothermobacter ehrlichii]|uniref:tRNA modification GTPase MnmE n=1 Tax=Geothermobacter ehrlichii TaxID=213224 RepID=A0A5D3WIE9_9BACT|nr:tRNA uridine-5-carboxymethylaminomethyl(34) synthesis GTPase MnmE [Geothermobacter ehrlichii]TYO97663.1 tRNA modification GTPase trmE [Geothermobacter ehrlichii]